MVRHSRKNKRGGDKIDDILVRIDSIKEEIKGLKGLPQSITEEPTVMSEMMPEIMPEIMPSLEQSSMSEPVMEASIVKSWVDDKNKKFRDGAGGRVSLSFSRIMTLLDNNINKGDVKKDWASIKRDLNNANSVEEVQNIIDRYMISFSANYVAGTRRRKNRKGGKRRTHRRH
jgi:5'-3' exonuclease